MPDFRYRKNPEYVLLKRVKSPLSPPIRFTLIGITTILLDVALNTNYNIHNRFK